MRVEAARPDVTSLVFRLFCRTVHPELLDVYAQTTVQQAAYSVQLQICDAGHVISFQHGGQTLCEVATSLETPLPNHRQVIALRLRGHRNESVEHDGGILYHVSFQVEQLEPEVFLQFHEELLLDATRSRLAHRFSPTSRLSPAPLSVIQTEERPRSLLLHAFHTFPDNRAIVKTQSLFEVRGDRPHPASDS
ncbi:MAG TPA: DUF2617 family protein [Planctomycetaceae bacterium]|nr:DUF2617 family protein [Planctomycetaceae bacterium]